MTANKPLKITDTTLRDAHQSSFATRLRLADMEPIIADLDAVGFHSLEVWGGATFDVAHRFLGEDPWDRLKRIKKLAPRTPLQMLLRGQNLVGYRNYPDDVVRAFCFHAVECGMDIFRVFDALNDPRNFEAAFKALHETNAHIQATISFSLTEPQIGGSVFNLDYFKTKAREFLDLGAHSLCVKDMAGIMNPQDAYMLIKELKKIVDVPIHLHSHFTAGLADMTYLKAIEAGVDVVDCALAPFALRSSQPAAEPLVVALRGSKRETGLSLEKMFGIGEYLEKIAPMYRHFFALEKISVIDIGVLRHQIPGGMLSNLVNQLREAKALDKLDEVYRELPHTRKDLGYPPLVTPTSQIVGVQAVMNVLGGERYKLVSKEVKDYCYGLYGRPPAPIDPEVQAKVLKGYERGETPITCRPADILEPELEKAKAAIKDLSGEIGDVLIYALYPRTGLDFLRYKYGLTQKPPGERVKSLEDVKREDDLVKKALAGELVERTKVEDLGPTRKVRVAVEGKVYEVLVEAGNPAAVSNSAMASIPVVRPAVQNAGAKSMAPAAAQPAPAKSAIAQPAGGLVITAPMPGTVVRYLAAVGDKVKAGQSVVILEAMKMENALPSPGDGKIAELGPPAGSIVARGDILAVIA